MHLPHLRILKAVYHLLHSEPAKQPTAAPECLIHLLLENVSPVHTQTACRELGQLGLLIDSRGCNHALGHWHSPSGAELDLTFDNQTLVAARNGEPISAIHAPYHALPDRWWALTPKGYRMHSKLTEVERHQQPAPKPQRALPGAASQSLNELGVDAVSLVPPLPRPTQQNIPQTPPLSH